MSDNSPRDSLAELDKRLLKARGEQPSAEQQNVPDGGQRNALGLAMRVGVELVAGVAVGVILGLMLDRWLGTSPWGLLGMFFLGAGAGFLNVYRAVYGMGSALGYRPPEAEDAAEERNKDR